MTLREWWQERRIWRRWKERYDYRQWALELRRQLVSYGVRCEALQELLNAKQDKINRLQAWIRSNQDPAGIATNRAPRGLHFNDMRPERLLNTQQHFFTEFSRHFEERMEAYERTGQYDPVDVTIVEADRPD